MFKKIIDRLYGNRWVFFLPLLLVIVFVLLVLGTRFSSTFSGGNYEYNNISLPVLGSPASRGGSAFKSEQSVDNSYVASPSVPSGEVDQTDASTLVPSSSVSVDRKVVKNASIDILVNKVEDTATGIQTIANKYSGSVDSLNISSGGADTKYGTVTIRVPNDEFDSAIEEVKSLAVKVESVEISSEDVTLQYVDLGARLKSKQAVESQYVALLQKANNVNEIVSVSSYLNTVREDIERLQAQMNYMSQQVAMSSITISMTSEAEVQVLGITWHPLTVIKQSFRNLLSDLSGIVDWLISFIFMLPGLIIKLGIFVGILWIIIKVIKKIYKKIRKN